MSMLPHSLSQSKSQGQSRFKGEVDRFHRWIEKAAKLHFQEAKFIGVNIISLSRFEKLESILFYSRMSIGQAYKIWVISPGLPLDA